MPSKSSAVYVHFTSAIIIVSVILITIFQVSPSATIQPQPSSLAIQETLLLPVDGSSITSTTVLTSGVIYTIKVSGTFSAGGPYLADAEYGFNESLSTVLDKCPSPVVDIGVGINDSVNDDRKSPFWGQLTSTHVYTVELVGQGKPISLNYHDCVYDDNVGFLTIDILHPANESIQEVIQIPVDGSSVTSIHALNQDIKYTLRASGAFLIDPDGGIGDAEYGPRGPLDDKCVSPFPDIDLGIGINDTVNDNNKSPFWGVYNPAHVYVTSFVGQGSQISLNYHDCRYYDNSGSLTLEIMRSAGGYISSPINNLTIGPTTLIFHAETWNDAVLHVKRVEFYVYYDGMWHNAGLDDSYPYEVSWQTPNKLRSQQLMFGIHVIDSANNKTEFAGGVHQVNYLESLGNPDIAENWIPTRAYLNQRSLQPDGDSKCSVASMAMMLAMNSIISPDYNAIKNKANEMYPRVLKNGTAYVYKMTAELNKQGLIANYSSGKNGLSANDGWKTIKQEIDAGRPVLVRTANVTAAGHFIVAVGYREATGSRQIIVYDPFGRWKGTCCINNYDLNSKNADSRKGQWVSYDFDQTFGSFNWLITARPKNMSTGIVGVALSPSTPPDTVSDEREMIGTYLGVDIEIGQLVFLPLIIK